jgi:hypothetical protein
MPRLWTSQAGDLAVQNDQIEKVASQVPPPWPDSSSTKSNADDWSTPARCHSEFPNFKFDRPERRTSIDTCGTGNTCGTWISFASETERRREHERIHEGIYDSYQARSSNRKDERNRILQMLDVDEKIAQDAGQRGGLTPEAYARLPFEERLSTLSEELLQERRFEFRRFERLCVINLLAAQHELVKIDERLSFSTGELPKRELEDAQSALGKYREFSVSSPCQILVVL